MAKETRDRVVHLYVRPPQNWSMKTFAWNDLPYCLKCCPCYGLHPLQAVMSADNVVVLAERQIQVCETSPALPCSMLTTNLSHQLKRNFERFSLVVV